VLSILEHILFRALFVGLRVAGLMTFVPFLGSTSTPTRAKAGLTIVLTALLYPVSPVPDAVLPPLGWTRVALGEVMLGMTVGLCMQFVLEAAQLAGQVAGFQFGFSLVNVIDPQTNVDTPVLSIFYQLVALLLFLQLNVHHWILRGMAKSFEYVPVGSAVISARMAEEFLRDAGSMWFVGVQIATPVLLATLVLDVTVGFLSKASPQMPAILLSIPMKNLIGYVVLAISLTLWPRLFERNFMLALGWSERMLHLAH
jgi:flagellar biosynthesis protein FliR